MKTAKGIAAAPSDVLLLLYEGHAYPRLEKLSRVRFFERPLRRLFADSDFRRNPRTSAYMTDLVRDALGSEYEGSMLRFTSSTMIAPARLAEARVIVLLWRDGNGCGWSSIERLIWRRKRIDAAVRVLNGRRRQFDLTPSVRLGYLLRRFVEKSMIPEVALFALFWLVTPWLALRDLVRNRG